MDNVEFIELDPANRAPISTSENANKSKIAAYYKDLFGPFIGKMKTEQLTTRGEQYIESESFKARLHYADKINSLEKELKNDVDNTNLKNEIQDLKETKQLVVNAFRSYKNNYANLNMYLIQNGFPPQKISFRHNIQQKLAKGMNTVFSGTSEIASQTKNLLGQVKNKAVNWFKDKKKVLLKTPSHVKANFSNIMVNKALETALRQLRVNNLTVDENKMYLDDSIKRYKQFDSAYLIFITYLIKNFDFLKENGFLVVKGKTEIDIYEDNISKLLKMEYEQVQKNYNSAEKEPELVKTEKKEPELVEEKVKSEKKETEGKTVKSKEPASFDYDQFKNLFLKKMGISEFDYIKLKSKVDPKFRDGVHEAIDLIKDNDKLALSNIEISGNFKQDGYNIMINMWTDLPSEFKSFILSNVQFMDAIKPYFTISAWSVYTQFHTEAENSNESFLDDDLDDKLISDLETWVSDEDIDESIQKREASRKINNEDRITVTVADIEECCKAMLQLSRKAIKYPETLISYDGENKLFKSIAGEVNGDWTKAMQQIIKDTDLENSYFNAAFNKKLASLKNYINRLIALAQTFEQACRTEAMKNESLSSSNAEYARDNRELNKALKEVMQDRDRMQATEQKHGDQIDYLTTENQQLRAEKEEIKRELEKYRQNPYATQVLNLTENVPLAQQEAFSGMINGLIKMYTSISPSGENTNTKGPRR